jgi:hypothetical protein
VEEVPYVPISVDTYLKDVFCFIKLKVPASYDTFVKELGRGERLEILGFIHVPVSEK